jgi:hypothetical protein
MLARFERLMEQAVEGGLRRVLPTQLQPVQLAKAAARAMENSRRIGPYGAQVANVYVLRLSPEDVERFQDYSAVLVRELSRYLTDEAAQRGFRPAGPIRVDLVGDATLATGTLRAEALTRLTEAELWISDALGRRVRLDPTSGRVRLGRGTTNDVVIASQRISRHHAELRWDEAGWRVHDLGSTNGTFVDGERVAPSAPRLVRPGARLRLADHEFQIGA